MEDQGSKQIKTIKDNKKQLANINSHSYENELLLLMEREIFKNIYNERLDKIELSKKINYDLKFNTY